MSLSATLSLSFSWRFLGDLGVLVVDGKVWLQADNADLRIAERLEEVGIPKGDIVLGFQPPDVRPYTEYAVA